MIYIEISSSIFDISMMRSNFRKDHKERDHFEIVHAGKFSLAGVGSAWSEQACDGAFFFLADDGGDRGGKKFLNSGHVLAVSGGFVEAGAGPGVRIVPPDAKPSQTVKDLLGLGKGQEGRPVFSDMNQIMRREGITGFDRLDGRIAFGAQAEDDAGRHSRFSCTVCRHNRKYAERKPFQLMLMILEKTGQIDAEIREGQVGNGNAAGEILKVDDNVLQLEQLLAAVFQIVHLVAGLKLDEVFFAGGGDVQKHHAPADPLFEVDVFLQLHIGPEVDELDAAVGGADPVDAAETLDDADGIPVNVVVDEPVAILKVLAFGDAIRGDEQVELSLAGQLFRTFFGARRECRQDRGEVPAQVGERCPVASRPGHQRAVDTETFQRPGGQMFIEVMGCVGKCGKDDNLAVSGVDGVEALLLDDLAQGIELGVACGADLLRGGMKGRQAVAVLDKVLLPTHKIHIMKQHLYLASDQQGLESRVVNVHIGNIRFLDRFCVLFDPGERCLDVGHLTSDGQCK